MFYVRNSYKMGCYMYTLTRLSVGQAAGETTAKINSS